MDDDLWIPRVTAEGMAIISRDMNIADRRSERDAVIASGARMFAITARGKLHNWDLLEIVVVQWRRMEQAAKEDGPYIYALTRTTMDKIDLVGGVKRRRARGTG